MVKSICENEIAIVIVASGVGHRFGGDRPKQFCNLAGRPVLMHTVDAFRVALPKANILLMLSEEGCEMWQELCAQYGFESPRVAIGGDTRVQTVRNAMVALKNIHPSWVMIHDGARPLVSAKLIAELVNALAKGALIAVPGFQPSDSLEKIEDGVIVPVKRSEYFAVQTPQCISYGDMEYAYSLENYEGVEFTDDASLVHTLLGRAITVVPGDRYNIKITFQADIAIAETLLNNSFLNPLN